MSHRPFASLSYTAAWIIALACVAGDVVAQDTKGDAPKIVPPRLVAFVEATYPPEALDRGVRADVVLELDLDVDGKVMDARVKSSGGAEFDKAALDAGRRLRFTPARYDGKPTPVRIQFRYRFAPKDRVDRRGFERVKTGLDRRPAEEDPRGEISLRGTVLERGTGDPVASATVRLDDLDREALTDLGGRFVFTDVPSGRHRLYVSSPEHKGARATVTLTAGRTLERTWRVERLSYARYRSVIEGPREPGVVARRSLATEEIQRIPGVSGDALKVVQNLPGVARSSFGGGQIIVRGSAPNDSLAFVDGVQVPLLYHFGGIYSVVNTDILDGVDFYPGAIPVRYGRLSGGVLEARLRAPRADRWRGYGEVNVFHGGLFLEGPITKDTTIAIAGRRSWVDTFLNAVVPADALSFTRAPVYYDYQVKLDTRIDARRELRLFLFGTDDRLSFLTSQPPPAFPDARGGIDLDTSFHKLIARYRYDGGPSYRAVTTLAGGWTLLKLGGFGLFEFDLLSFPVDARHEITQGDGRVKWRTGFDVKLQPFDVTARVPLVKQGGGAPVDISSAPFVQNTTRSYQLYPGVYTDAILDAGGGWTLVPGVRLDAFLGDMWDAVLDPRITVRKTISAETAWKASAGARHQPPQPQEVGKEFGNPDLRAFGAWEISTGVEHKLTDMIHVDVQGFYKRLSSIPVQPKNAVGTQVSRYTNSGRGEIVGGELFLRHASTDRFFGWVSYTFQRALRQDHPDAAWRSFDFDQTHILTAIGSWRLGANWEAGFRWRFVTGNPYTAIVDAKYDADRLLYTSIPSTCRGCERIPAFHQLDVRVDKKFVFERWMFNAYVDVQNVYNRQNAEAVQLPYDKDPAKRGYTTGLPIIPSVGLRGEF